MNSPVLSCSCTPEDMHLGMKNGEAGGQRPNTGTRLRRLGTVIHRHLGADGCWIAPHKRG